MKQTIVSRKRIIIIFFSLFLPLMFLSIYRIEYTFTAPGFNDDISGFITIESEYEMKGSFHTTSVIVLEKITLLQYLIGELERKVEVKEFPDYYDTIDLDELDTMGFLMKDNSLLNSLVVGIKQAGYSVTYETHMTVYLTYDYLDENTLKIGDKILSINGNTDVYTAAQEVTCNSTALFEIERGNDNMTFTVTKHELAPGECSFGLYLSYFSEITETEVVYSIKETNTGGPSGGLMQALYIYNALTESDITKGYKIGGTGTINIDGTVGSIGGIEQKIYTSIANGIDVFFVPHLSESEDDNYVRAMALLETLETDMVVVGVTTINDAITFLQSYQGGN